MPMLVWSARDGLKGFNLEQGEHFVGRLPRAVLVKLVPEDRLFEYVYRVFAFTPATGRAAVVSEQPCPTVSRYHAKIVVEASKSYVVDHGPEGRGSKNGTIVDDVFVPPGRSVPLHSGARIKLGFLGPMIMYVEGSTVTLPEGVPVEVGQELGRRIPSSQRVSAAAGSEVIVPKSGEARMTVMDEKGRANELRVVVVEERREDVRMCRAIRSARTRILELLAGWSRMSFEERMGVLESLLGLDVYRELLSKAGVLDRVSYAYDCMDKGDYETALSMLMGVNERLKSLEELKCSAL